MKDQQSCISIFVAYLTFSSGSKEHQPRYDSNILCKTVWKIYRVIKEGGSFSSRENVRAPIQSRREMQPEHLERWSSSRSDLSVFTSMAPASLDWSNKTSWVFPALKSTSHFLLQSTVYYRSDSSSDQSILVVATNQMPDHT